MHVTEVPQSLQRQTSCADSDCERLSLHLICMHERAVPSLSLVDDTCQIAWLTLRSDACAGRPADGSSAASKPKKSRKSRTRPLPLPPDPPLAVDIGDDVDKAATGSKGASGSDAPEPPQAMAGSAGDGKPPQKLTKKQAKKAAAEAAAAAAAAAASSLPQQSSASSSSQHHGSEALSTDSLASQALPEADAVVSGSTPDAALRDRLQSGDRNLSEHRTDCETEPEEAPRTLDQRFTVLQGREAISSIAADPAAPGVEGASHGPPAGQGTNQTMMSRIRGMFSRPYAGQPRDAAAGESPQPNTGSHAGVEGGLPTSTPGQASLADLSLRLPGIPSLQEEAPPARFASRDDPLLASPGEATSHRPEVAQALPSSSKLQGPGAPAPQQRQNRKPTAPLTVPRPRLSPVQPERSLQPEEPAPSQARASRREHLFAPKAPLRHQVGCRIRLRQVKISWLRHAVSSESPCQWLLPGPTF